MTQKYTAADLALLAGVPLRTVRYHVRAGLINVHPDESCWLHGTDWWFSTHANWGVLRCDFLACEVIRRNWLASAWGRLRPVVKPQSFHEPGTGGLRSAWRPAV